MRRTDVFMSFLVVLALQFVCAQGTCAQEEFARKSKLLIQELHTFFPVVTGTVVSVRDEHIFIDIGLHENIRVGAQLALLAEGIEIVDPKSQKVLGKYEEQIGAIQLTEIQEQFSVAKALWTEATTEIAPGTHVGSIPGKVKVAILPIADQTEQELQTDSAYEFFVDAMRADGRFTVLDAADIKAAAITAGLASFSDLDRQALSRINTSLEAQNFLQLSFQADADTILMQALLLSKDGREIGKAQEILRDHAALQQRVTPEKSALRQDVQQEVPVAETQPAAKQTLAWFSEILPIRVHKIAVGDLTGDGRNEVILATQNDLKLFEYARLGEKDAFRPLTTMKGYNDAKILALGVADINGNGREEIFLTTLRSVSAELRVFEFDSGTFREIQRNNGIVMRILRSPEGEKILVGQRTSASTSLDFLSGKISVYTWDGNNYSRHRTLNVPGRVDIFGFTTADLDGDGSKALLYYDDFDRVDVLREGTRLWRSRKNEAYRIPVVRKGEDPKKGRRIPGKIELVALGQDRHVHLILFENLSPFRFIEGLPLYNASRIHVLRWTGESFERIFQSEDSDGYTVDYAVADVDNDGRQEVVLAKVLQGDDFFKRPKSQLMVYELD
ncbi:hypothetical protein CSB45_04500 [candidate division KSB3 bacterium]|uniref:Flagellar assembly protein T C-terminal domain-containing protein n=1 Tax=candidate division KSB3 bacterium TaxID=2044937 RepID=A0A2G6E900_9BACT|nr:MAG: hypothetical protein CSB45_04500 [candidate division KSB3 bacterium]PIE30637.1 MAG: hypothetical protein CSA57_03085 [candidate division KSB3 bacterium]